MFDRRKFMLKSLLALVGVNSLTAAATADDIEILVYKSPTCGCCNAWIEHLRGAGFVVRQRNVADVSPIKNRHGVPSQLWSCHTAVIGGYVIEGHVPAHDIRRLLDEAPDVDGLAGPGMPAGSPGMEAGDYREAFNVWTFGGDELEAYARYTDRG